MSMSSRSGAVDVSEEEMESVLSQISTVDGKSVDELAQGTEYSSRQIQTILEALMERGEITSTPDWRYRKSRRSEV